MAVRTRDWFRQAESGLQPAKRSAADGHFEWACFGTAAAEKAVKALYQSVHIDFHWTFGFQNDAKLPNDLRTNQELVEHAKELDKHDIPSRYPSSHPEGAPLDYYTEPEARRALEGAERIVGFCGSKIPKDQL